MREKVTPAQKPVPYSGSMMKDGGHSTLTTPKKYVGGRYWGGKSEKGTVMGRKSYKM